MTYKLDEIKVLIVDDMKPMLTLTSSILKIFGFHNVIIADNGSDALRLIRQHQPDIAIVDWLMEPMNGLELIQKIRKDPHSPNPYLPIIMMSGFSAKGRVEQCRDNGVTEFLVKPFTAEDLATRITHVIEKPRQFVSTDKFFGPDRRRRKSDGYQGPLRRDKDTSAEEKKASREENKAKDILKKLKDEAKKI